MPSGFARKDRGSCYSHAGNTYLPINLLSPRTVNNCGPTAVFLYCFNELRISLFLIETLKYKCECHNKGPGKDVFIYQSRVSLKYLRCASQRHFLSHGSEHCLMSSTLSSPSCLDLGPDRLSDSTPVKSSHQLTTVYTPHTGQRK